MGRGIPGGGWGGVFICSSGGWGRKRIPGKGTMKTVCGYTEKEGEDQQQDPSARCWGMLTVSAVSIPERTGDTEKRNEGAEICCIAFRVYSIFFQQGTKRASSESNASIPRIKTTDYQKDAKRF